MVSAQVLFVLLIGWSRNFVMNFDPFVHSENEILPWIGVMRVKSDINDNQAATGLVMIKKYLAVGNANDVANVKIDTLRMFAKAMFYKKMSWWECDIRSYLLHPEYFSDVKNTLAIVYLSCDKDDMYWTPIELPGYNTTHDNVYSVGLTDSHQQLQQIIDEMEVVNNADCHEFYMKEKLSYKSLEPSQKLCYKVLNATKQCVIDAGMALTVRSEDTWTLIGISTFGPGCSLPSRFIQFLPYIPWINFHLIPTSNQMNIGRSNYLYEQGLEEPFEDQERFILKKIHDNTIVMRPSLAYVTEHVHGKCDDIDGVVLYRELSTIKAPTNTATGIYSISLYDLFFPTITCVMVTVFCDKRSKTRYWVTTGFHQEDIDNFIKIIPIPKRNGTKAPKIWYIKDLMVKYQTVGTVNLEFKFEFTNAAKIDVSFYGKNVTTPMRPPRLLFRPTKKQTTGQLPGGAQFNAREDEPESDDDSNDPFYHF